MTLHTFGVGVRQQVCSEILKASVLAEKFDTIILLPIPSSKDNIHITGTELPLADLLKIGGKRVLIAGYGLPLPFARRAVESGFSIVDVICDERFLVRNAELTAHGTAGVILTENKNDVSELRIGIIGYGRIGKILSRILLFLGADVVVFSRREEVRLELCGVGIEAKHCEEISDLCRLDILINTAPAEIVSPERAKELSDSGCKLIELASGERLPSVPGLTRLPSVPDKSYPISAGRIYAAAILRAACGGAP